MRYESKILAGMVFAGLLGCTSAFAATLPPPPAGGGMLYNTAIIKACGMGLAIGNDKLVRENCLRDARHKAAEKAVARFIAPSPAPDSLYQQIVSSNAAYITQPIKVVKEQNAAGKLFLFCDVPVNFEQIQEEIKKHVMVLQKQNRRDKAVFLVRMVNMPQDASDNIWRDVLVQYEEAFKIYNFKALGAETAGSSVMLMLDTVKNIDTQHTPYDVYRKNVLEALSHVAEVSVAVIGEIDIGKIEAYPDSVYSDAMCRVEVVRLKQDGYDEIGNFADLYSVIRPTKADALNIVSQAAAVKSAKHLADITYQYWQNHK